MKSILKELFDGSIYPDELIISRDPEYWPLNQKISGTMDMWRNKLSKDDFTELEALLDLRSQVDSMHAEASFMYGFKLASWIMIEVMTGKGELVVTDRLQSFLDQYAESYHRQQETVEKQLTRHFDDDRAYAAAIAREIMMYGG